MNFTPPQAFGTAWPLSPCSLVDVLGEPSLPPERDVLTPQTADIFRHAASRAFNISSSNGMVLAHSGGATIHGRLSDRRCFTVDLSSPQFANWELVSAAALNIIAHPSMMFISITTGIVGINHTGDMIFSQSPHDACAVRGSLLALASKIDGNHNIELMEIGQDPALTPRYTLSFPFQPLFPIADHLTITSQFIVLGGPLPQGCAEENYEFAFIPLEDGVDAQFVSCLIDPAATTFVFLDAEMILHRPNPHSRKLTITKLTWPDCEPASWSCDLGEPAVTVFSPATSQIWFLTASGLQNLDPVSFTSTRRFGFTGPAQQWELSISQSGEEMALRRNGEDYLVTGQGEEICRLPPTDGPRTLVGGCFYSF